ncbi:hypothetical protein [Chthonobacter albigriseus]|uniref:hypothetical protein n=1 Tax=Chthonobacter albigriseus TaxID=1683161 RepID=UPI0015EE7306|nr:hypothetical protein [Chthonobacter albigriseus]
MKPVTLAFVAALVAASGPVAAGTATPPPSPENNATTLPAPQPPCTDDVTGEERPCENLSEQLGATGGVITPPAVSDGEIQVPAPDPNPGTTPVIPPSAVPEQQPEGETTPQ